MQYITGADTLHMIADKTKWLSRIFGHTMKVKWYTPPVWVGKTHELDEPFRRGYTVLVRYSWSSMLALGFWGKPQDPDKALLDATILGRKRSDDERQHWSDDVRDASFSEGVRLRSQHVPV